MAPVTLGAVVQIEVVVAPDEVDLVSGELWAAGVAGIEEREVADGVLLIVAVDPEHVAGVDALLAGRTTSQADADAERWVDAWRPYARAVRIDERIVVQPPWVAPIAVAGDVVVSVDPGRAWGHGAHPSTLLAARLMLRCGVAGRTVLDLGCGSGVLSLVAAASGAARVVGTDIDPAAVEATLANAAVNGCETVVEASLTPAPLLDGPFDVVVANIGLVELRDLAGVVAGLVTDGDVVLSGLLDEQVDEIVAAVPELVEVERLSSDGWGAVRLRRR